MSQTETDTRERSILVVDDTPENLRLLVGMLAGQGFKVRPVPSGPLALAAVQAALPDLILLDINMPEMNGYEVCKRLKASAATQDIPVIFISALGEIEDKVKAFHTGGVDYVTKPFQLEEVLARVETHLALRQLQQQLQQANQELETANAVLEQRVAERTADLVRLNAALERFVPRELLAFLHKESIADVGLGDQVQRQMTILFSDIRGFTSLSERMTPQENFAFINDYLSQVGPVIRQHRGFIDKYVGDAIVALFPERPEDALDAASAMVWELERFNAHRQQMGSQPIRTGIGVHTGSLMLGIVGEEQRIQGTVISDAVNLASRLQDLTKQFGVSILVSEKTVELLQERKRYCFRFLDRLQVKGKQEVIGVYEMGETAAIAEGSREP